MSEDVGEATSKPNASTEPKKAEETRYCKAKDAAYKYCQKAARHLCKPKTLVPNLTLVAVISYTVLTGCQLIIARDSLTDSQRALTDSQRAFMFPAAFYPYATKNLVGLSALWKNSGNTPTKNLVVWTDSGVFHSPMTSDFSFSENPPTGKNEHSLWIHSFVGPQATFSSVFAVRPYDSSKLGKSQFVYVWGWAKYNDIFDDSVVHLTRFCEQIVSVVPDAQTKGVYDVNFMPCDYGNCADEECSAEGIPPPT